MKCSKNINDLFNEEELIEILKGLIQRKSQNPLETEEEVAKYVQHLLIENNIKAELSYASPGRPNVIAKIKGAGDGPTILYNGHLDVVPAGCDWNIDPFDGIIKDDRMYGRGTADMKSGVAAMIYAAIILNRMGNRFLGQLILFFNVDEERENLGMLKFLEEEHKADFAIISEPTSLDICIGHKGVARYRVKTYGTNGHVSFVEKPDNALYKMTKLINELEKLSFVVKEKEHPLIGKASLAVTQIKGGTAPNIVPNYCEIEIDRRLLPGEKQEEVLSQIEECLNIIAKSNNFEYELENYLFIPASYIDESHSFIKQVSQSILAVKKHEPEIKAFEACCEAPFLSVEKGIPTIICGPGNLQQAHVTDEYVELNQVKDASKIFIDLILRML